MLSLQAAVLALAVSGAGETVLFDFYADWCGPCRQMEPTVRQLAARGYPVRKVNIDQHRELAAQYRIGPVPCFVLVVDGREAGRIEGATRIGELEEMFRAAGIGRGAALAPQARAQSPDEATPRLRFPGTKCEAPSAATRFLGDAPAPSRQPVREGAGQPLGADASTARLLAAAVRLKIDDGGSHSVGSGTIIDARAGEALVLTCGHIFRDSQGKGPITVDLFGGGAPQALPGRLISYDLPSDIGLVSIRPGVPVMVARVAPPRYIVRRDDSVINIGCNNGESPTARSGRLAAIDKFLGPPNFVVSGQPVQGRSGGGLFTADGLVIGVCNAADPADDEGLYAALASIHAELDRAGLSEMCLEGVEPAATLASQGAPEREWPGQLAEVEPPPMAQEMPSSADQRLPLGTIPTSAAAEAPLGAAGAAAPSAEEAAVLEAIRRKSRRAEVICIIRPLDDPGARTEIIVLDKASPAFLRQLAADSRPAHD